MEHVYEGYDDVSYTHKYPKKPHKEDDRDDGRKRYTSSKRDIFQERAYDIIHTLTYAESR